MDEIRKIIIRATRPDGRVREFDSRLYSSSPYPDGDAMLDAFDFIWDFSSGGHHGMIELLDIKNREVTDFIDFPDPRQLSLEV